MREQGAFTLPDPPTLVYDKMCSFLSTLPHLILVWVTTKWLSIIMKIREQFTHLLVPSPATPVPASAQVPAQGGGMEPLREQPCSPPGLGVEERCVWHRIRHLMMNDVLRAPTICVTACDLSLLAAVICPRR